MEGLIPFVYRAIMQPKNDDAPSSYVRLPTGDSGRFQSSHINVFRSDQGRSSASPLPSSTTHRPNIGSSMLEFSHQAVMWCYMNQDCYTCIKCDLVIGLCSWIERVREGSLFLGYILQDVMVLTVFLVFFHLLVSSLWST